MSTLAVGDDTCWVCSSSELTVESADGHDAALTPDDLRITDKRYGLTLPLLRCTRCGFVFARRDALPALVALYEELDDAEYGDSAEGRRRQMAHLLRTTLGPSGNGRSLLDVGAASGVLVAEAEALGFDAAGVEPSAPLVELARSVGLAVERGVLPHPAFDGRRFDVVTIVDVIEHVDDPVGLLRLAAAHLAEGGCMVIVTPDAGSVAARLLGARWWHRRLAHVGYFDRVSLERALAESGLVAGRWSRPRWYFPVGYLARRVLQYVPGLRSDDTEGGPGPDGPERAHRPRLLLPLNLRDSFTVLVRPA